MKKKQLLCVLLTGLMLLVPYSGVLAEEPEIQTEELTLASGVEGEEAMISRFDRYVMTEGQEYELDLDGDGKTETISYKDTSVTDEDNGTCQAKAEIYRNGELLFSLESSEYSYYWRLSYCTMKDGKTCLLAASVSDNDCTAELLLLSQEDEDSLTERFETKRTVDMIDIAVIRVPRISNFTDFNPLESIQGVSLRYVKNPSELGNPDMIILPGTKNTMEDLLWMRENGLEALILKEAAKGKLIFGICGGYQMMGETLSDPHGVEAGGTIKGMGLLPMDTVFAKKKTRTRVEGSFGQLTGAFAKLSDTALEGYEIHMGETALKGDAKPSTSIQDSVTGERKADGAYLDNVCGTYVHGVFDKEAVAEAIVQIIGEKKGLDVSGMTGMDFQAFKETQYDILAAELRKHLDMKKIYEILEEGVQI